jgi:hypothetical protein
MALTLGIAATGILRRTDLVPPPFLLMFLSIFAVGIGLARSELGGRLSRELPLFLLVLLQGFRFPLELVMHVAGAEGTMPVALSFDGYNFDVLTGVSAIGLGLALRLRELPLWVVQAWNVLGMVALANIAGIALLSSPLIGYFGADQLNTWVTYPPFIWLPAVLVVAAVAGHGIVLRRLLAEAEVGRSGVNPMIIKR